MPAAGGRVLVDVHAKFQAPTHLGWYAMFCLSTYNYTYIHIIYIYIHVHTQIYDILYIYIWYNSMYMLSIWQLLRSQERMALERDPRLGVSGVSGVDDWHIIHLCTIINILSNYISRYIMYHVLLYYDVWLCLTTYSTIHIYIYNIYICNIYIYICTSSSWDYTNNQKLHGWFALNHS